jgi:hypothetical protein
MPKKHQLTTEFIELVKFHLDDFVVARGVTPQTEMAFRDKLQKVIRNSDYQNRGEFFRDFFYLLRDVCGFETDDEVAAAFRLKDSEFPLIDEGKRTEASRKLEEAERLRDEAQREADEIFQRDNRIREIIELLPRLREAFELLEGVPNELRSIIADCNDDAAKKGYSISPYSQIGNRSDYLIRVEARAHAAALALEKHPARLERARKEITELETELERLEPKRSKKRKTA